MAGGGWEAHMETRVCVGGKGSCTSAGETVWRRERMHSLKVTDFSLAGLLNLKSLLYLYILQIKAYGFRGESGSLNLFLGIKIH